MPNLTFCGETYAVNHAVKGADYIHGYDANGVCIVAFEGVADLTAIGYDGTFMAPGDCAEEACNKVVYCGGKLKTLGGGAVSVPRANLANDALYSPMKVCPASYTITADDLGRTLMNGASAGSGDMEFILPDDVAEALPWGAEIAILYRRGSSVTITFGAGTYSAAPSITSDFAYGRSYTISDLYGLIAIKKIDASSSSSYWLVTGNVEVVA